MNAESLLLWSRAQFALTACYHWLFVPLTLGLGVIMAMAETVYYRTGKPEWKRWAQFWQKLFGINFAIGLATGIILEFEFGTNWSNYSWLVGDIFGAPLAIEGILAFFMESTFVAVMFFGWNKVSKGFHLSATWLTIIGATISAVWILIANAWMQDPVGSTFNPDTVRTEMSDFWAVALSSTAINKFWHTVSSSWLLGSVFALAVCAFELWRKKHVAFALANFRMVAAFGLVAALITAITGDTSAYNVAQRQPMKLATMEALFDAGASTPDAKTVDGKGVALSAFGVLAPKANELGNSSEEPFLFNIKVPSVLSWLSTRSADGYVPGINNLLEGGFYHPDGTLALSADEKIARGKQAIEALKLYHEAKKQGDEATATVQKQIIEENFPYFGYGYIQDKSELVPNIYINYYSFRIMVGLGVLFILLFVLALVYSRKPEALKKAKCFHWVAMLSVPLVYLASQSGWVLAEVGRQPWAIQDMLPLSAAVSKLESQSVMVTFFVFAVLFTILLIAELGIMRKAIKQGPGSDDKE